MNEQLKLQIEKEANERAETFSDQQNAFIAKVEYIAGATAWAERGEIALDQAARREEKLVAALESVLPYLKAVGTNGNHWVPQVETALAEWKEGKVEEERICPNCNWVFNADRNGCCRKCGA